MIKKLNKVLESPYFWFLFFLLASVVYFYPFLRNPAFNLIDDGHSLKVAKEISTGDFSNIVEVSNGRFRSMYWMYFVVVYLIGGDNPFYFWVGQTFIVTMTLFLIWYLVKNKLSKNVFANSLPFLISLFFFIPEVSENLYRLGTGEVRQMFFSLLFLIWLKNNQIDKWPNYIGYLIFFLAILTKETSIMLLPLLVIYKLPFIISGIKKNNKHICNILFFSVITLFFYLFINALKEGSTYGSNFSINWSEIKYNILVSRITMKELFYILFFLFSLTFSRFVFFLREKIVLRKIEANFLFTIIIKFLKDNILEVAFFTGVLESLFFVFSWEFQLGRYYYPVYIFLLLYAVSELEKSIAKLRNIKLINKFIFMLIPLLIMILSYFFFFQHMSPNFKNKLDENYKIKQRWFQDYQNSYAIIENLLSWSCHTIYTTVSDYEVIYELGLYGNRLSIKKNNCKIYSSSFKTEENFKNFYYSENVIEDFIQDEDKNKILISKDPIDNLDMNYFHRSVYSSDNLDAINTVEWEVWKEK